MIVLLTGYVATCLGAASVMLTSGVCTQYGMASLIPAAPLVILFGGFVVLAFAVAGVREGGALGIVSLGALAAIFGFFLWTVLIAWRGTAPGPLVFLALGLFGAVLAAISAVTSFAFCLSMSV